MTESKSDRHEGMRHTFQKMYGGDKMDESLGEALPKEIERVQVIITEYELVPGGALAAMLMRQDVRKAHNAMISGDLAGMLASYKALKEYNL